VILLLFWAATFGNVFLMALQSRNVNTGRYFGAAVTSVMIGTAQLVTVRGIIDNGPLTVWLLTSTAGPAGVVCAMLFFSRMFKR
jgi:hypothetical protein